MITGFNTDIEFQGVTYHVQTEDKGLATPLILSLVYNGGTILASKRSPYDDLLLEDFDEKILIERLQRQHKLICAAISSGRIEDLKRMSMKPSASETVEKSVPKKIELPAVSKIIEGIKTKSKEFDLPKLDIPEPQLLKEPFETGEEIPVEQFDFDLEQILAEERVEAERRAEVPIQKPKPKIWETREKEKPAGEILVVEAVEIIEEVEIISADAVEIIEEKTPSQKFLEELSRAQSMSGINTSSDELTVKILSDEEFYSGDEKSIEIYVFRGAVENALNGSHIMVKILGSAFSPLLYHAKTDGSGTATVHIKLPVFDHGRAIVLIKAMSGGDEAETRKIIKTR